jgi:hypothetical protein
LITVGQALHWFVPETTKREFSRILKRAGWLAVLWNHGTDQALDEALRQLSTEQNGWDISDKNQLPRQPVDFYYNGEDCLRMSFPQSRQETWEEFIGALCSSAYAPDVGDPLYANLERAAKRVFDRFSSGGRIMVDFSTELRLGQIGRIEE